MTTRLSRALIAGAATLIAAPLAAQLLPPIAGGGSGGGLGGAVGGVVNEVGGAVGGVAGPATDALAMGAEREQRRLSQGAFDRVGSLSSSIAGSPASLLDLRRLRLTLLIDAHRKELASDGAGNPIRRDRLIVIDPTAAQLTAAGRAGFPVITQQREPSLGLMIATLSVPTSTSPRKALDALRRAAPGIDADYDHIFEPAGSILNPVAALLAGGAAGFVPSGTRIAMIDGGVASHPALAGAAIEQRGFAGPAAATGHGTAVASLLVGNDGAFKGAARGANLYVADVYGGNAAAGSASTIVRALGWAAGKGPRLINISLVGPANRAMEKAVAILRARGIAVIAAVGNDGPSAPPQYPASYDGVIAITGVDGKGKALIEAGRARHLDFAAPGADLIAALPVRGYAEIRGTSFAAPLAAARFAATGSLDRMMAEARPGKGKVGHGIVCADCGLSPKAFKRN